MLSRRSEPIAAVEAPPLLARDEWPAAQRNTERAASPSWYASAPSARPLDSRHDAAGTSAATGAAEGTSSATGAAIGAAVHSSRPVSSTVRGASGKTRSTACVIRDSRSGFVGEPNEGLLGEPAATASADELDSAATIIGTGGATATVVGARPGSRSRSSTLTSAHAAERSSGCMRSSSCRNWRMYACSAVLASSSSIALAAISGLWVYAIELYLSKSIINPNVYANVFNHMCLRRHRRRT